MAIVRFFVPLVFSILIGTSYSIIFNKKFSDSIAPAYFIQIMLMLFSAMIFGSTTLGIALGILISFVIIGIDGHKLKSIGKMKDRIYQVFHADSSDIEINGIIAKKRAESGVNIFILFLFLYCFVYIINFGKFFIKYDEFSHWGIFIKETLRLDNLYCTSTANMAHKDYVPAGTLFEALWCRLSFRFSEADSYRGIQMLQLSMLFPMATYCGDKDRQLSSKASWIRLVTIILIPLLISSSPALWFYHTIYKDVIFGIMFFYCMWIAISENDIKYAVFVETLAITVMILTKMTALAVLPMVVIFFGVYHAVFNNGRKYIPLYIVECAIPVSIWVLFNMYVDRFVPNTGSNQSYDSVGTQLIDVITHNGTISYQSDVERYFFKSLFNWKLVGRLPFFWAISIFFSVMFVLSYIQKDKIIKRKIRLLNLWILLSALVYTVLMLYLYCTAFSEDEARVLASFERYMSTYLFTALFLVYATFIVFTECGIKAQILVGILVLDNVLVATGCEQLVPGKLNNEEPKETEISTLINDKIQNKSISLDDSILVITGGDEIMTGVYLTYYCSPVAIDCESVEIIVLDASNSVSSKDYSKYSHILFCSVANIDEDCFKKLGDIFAGDTIENNSIYKAETVDNEVELISE